METTDSRTTTSQITLDRGGRFTEGNRCSIRLSYGATGRHTVASHQFAQVSSGTFSAARASGGYGVGYGLEPYRELELPTFRSTSPVLHVEDPSVLIELAWPANSER